MLAAIANYSQNQIKITNGTKIMNKLIKPETNGRRRKEKKGVTKIISYENVPRPSWPNQSQW